MTQFLFLLHREFHGFQFWNVMHSESYFWLCYTYRIFKPQNWIHCQLKELLIVPFLFIDLHCYFIRNWSTWIDIMNSKSMSWILNRIYVYWRRNERNTMGRVICWWIIWDLDLLFWESYFLSVLAMIARKIVLDTCLWMCGFYSQMPEILAQFDLK